MKQVETEFFDEKTRKELSKKVNFLLRFVVRTIAFELVDDTKDPPKLLLQAHIDDIVFGLELKKWVMVAMFSIGQMAVEDYICPKLVSDESEIMYLLETKGFRPETSRSSLSRSSLLVSMKNVDPFLVSDKNPFFKVSYRIEDRDSPTYRKVDQEIDVRAQSLIFYLRPETIYGIIDIL
ncbi:hypothetical protein RFI_30555 [Reticulomyxa filosa]|uniref:Uncharacterized protein n=1 Tax=Reticulomyxa filosa TaxID=46433 RepID=X6M0B6_RETFI|nr:hypothetical protein RFI_30555 [Reticulomyxa filosa]|eukprot:ETO06837.1 hypothetical protein RFI_30555 [Reticulomyxa filosa]